MINVCVSSAQGGMPQQVGLIFKQWRWWNIVINRHAVHLLEEAVSLNELHVLHPSLDFLAQEMALKKDPLMMGF